MDFPAVLLEEMDRVIKDETRERRRQQARAKTRGRR
jgi:hypothetical protein